MARMSYISSVERYQEYQTVIHYLLDSVLASLEDGVKKQQDNRYLIAQYPFLELQYCLDKNGVQLGNNVCFKRQYMKTLNNHGDSQDLSERPYFQGIQQQQHTRFTPPYISIATNHLCISAIKSLHASYGENRYLVIDVCLTQLIEFIMGDRTRATMTPFFKAGYGIIVSCLFILVLFLLGRVFGDIYSLLFVRSIENDPLEPFTICCGQLIPDSKLSFSSAIAGATIWLWLCGLRQL